MGRKILAVAFRRIEGLFFAGGLMGLLPGLLVAVIIRLARDRSAAKDLPGIVAVSLRRWARFLAQGLSPIREAWWLSLQYEPRRYVWRYVFLLEYFDLLNIADARRGAAPQSGGTRLLVLKIAHVGDALHMVPALREMKKQRPSWTLDLLVGPWCETLAKKIPYLDQAVLYRPHLLLFSRRHRRGAMSVWSEARQMLDLRRQRYDWIFSTSITSLIEVCLIHAVRPRAWAGASNPLSLYYAFSEERTQPYTTRQYEAQRIMNLLSLMGLAAGSAELEYWLNDEDRRFARTIRRECGAEGDVPLVAVAPGAGWPGKIWPEESFAAVADQLAETRGARVLLLGAPDEALLGERVCRAMRFPALNLCGKTTLDQMAALLAEADLFLGNDSAPLHFAVALGTPTISLFGPTSRFQWGPPESQRHRVLAAVELCPGCNPFHFLSSCDHDRRCMRSLSWKTVAQEADILLGRCRHPKSAIPNAGGAS